MKILLSITLAAATLGTLAAPAQADELAVDIQSGQLFYRGSFQNFGWSFSLSKTIGINGLGIYDYQGDGLVDVHQIGLWDSNHNLLATTMVDSGDPLTGDAGGGWRVRSISTLVLGPGTYVLGAHYTTIGLDGDYFVGQTGFTLADGLTHLDSLVTTGAILGFSEPVSSSDFGALGYFGPTMRITPVPEPAAWAMMIAGFGLIGAGQRRLRQRTAVTFATA